MARHGVVPKDQQRPELLDPEQVSIPNMDRRESAAGMEVGSLHQLRANQLLARAMSHDSVDDETDAAAALAKDELDEDEDDLIHQHGPPDALGPMKRALLGAGKTKRQFKISMNREDKG